MAKTDFRVIRIIRGIRVEKMYDSEKVIKNQDIFDQYAALSKITYNLTMTTQAVFQVPPLKERTRIPMKTIRAIAQRIVDEFQPEKIILFGSHAYGNPTGWSDVDMLVVMDTPDGELAAILEIAESLPDLSFRVDIIVRSRDVLEKRIKLGDWFLRDIAERGKVLYERVD